MSELEPRDEYLWDGGGPVDPEVERLERLLGRYRHTGAPPELESDLPSAPERARAPRRLRRVVAAALALAAGLVAVVALVDRPLPHEPTDIAAVPEEHATGAGYPVLGVLDCTVVRPGEELRSEAPAQLLIGALGAVDVDPGSELVVERAEPDVHRLFLARGRVRAKIVAAPRVFQIGTPAGDAIDLGCAYELSVDDAGTAAVRVTEGQVAFELGGREVYVPAGASCVSTPGEGPRAPFFEGADPAFRAAVEAVERAERPAAELVARAVTLSGREDGLTVWHLFRSERSSPELRRAAYESLASLFPKPQGVTEEGVLAGDEAMIDAWFERMSRWWR